MELSTLPYAALFRTLQHVDGGALYLLGISCRRLNLLAFDVIIRRHQYYEGGTPTAFRLKLPQDFSIVSVLRLSFFSSFPPSLKGLYLELNHEDSITLSTDLQRLLEMLTLKLTMPFSIFLRRIEKMTVNTPFSARMDNKDLFKAVLSTCTSCRSVIIVKSSAVCSYYDREPSLRDRSRSPYRGILEKPPPMSGQPYHWREKLKQPQFIFRHMLIFASLSYHFEQAIGDLRYIRELTFPNGPRLWGTAWSGILSGLASAISLKRLILDPTGIAPNEFLRTLAQLPKLECLSILTGDHSITQDTYDLWYTHKLSDGECVTLHSLRTLYLPLPYAAVILGQNLPKLWGVDIHTRGGTLFTPTSYKSFTTIASFMRVLKHPIKMSLRIKFSYYLGSANGMIKDLDGYFQTIFGNSMSDGNPFSAFSAVTVERISVLKSVPDYNFTQILAQWLRLFTNLRRMVFTDHYHNSYAPRVYPLIRVIHTQCPNIESVKLFTRECIVSEILSNEESYHQQGTPGAVTIGDLGQDIFYQISQYLETGELYPLTRLCSSLRDWALPLYLQRRCLPDPNTGIILIHLVHKRMETLTDISALTLAPPGIIHRLSVRVNADISLFVLFEFLHRILRLIRKCSAIGAVTLDLNGSYHRAADGHITEHSRIAWTELVFDVFCALAERSNSLAIHGKNALRNLVSLTPADHAWNYQGGRLQRMVKCPLKHELSTLEFDLESHGLPMVCDYMIARLQGSATVTHVHIFGVTSLASPSLYAIAKAFPMITHFQLSGSDILPEDILSTLCLLPFLQDLHLGGCQSYWDSAQVRLCPIEVTGPVPDLPLLRFLSAPKQYVDFLLDNGDRYSKLERLLIPLYYNYPRLAFMPQVDLIVLLQSLPETVLCVKARRNIPSICLDIVISDITDLIQERMTDVGWDVVALSTEEIILRQYVGTDHVDKRKAPAETALSLQRWLKLFPALQTLEFVSITDVRGLDLVLQREPFVEFCRGLHLVSVNGVQQKFASS